MEFSENFGNFAKRVIERPDMLAKERSRRMPSRNARLLLLAMCFGVASCDTTPALFGSAAQLSGADSWISASSCSESAHQLVNEAIEAANNVEAGRAWGLSQAALIIDPGCVAAQIAQAALASANEEWGSRGTRLAALEGQEMTPSERAWASVLSTAGDERLAGCEAAAEEFPNDALFARCAIPATAEGAAQLVEWTRRFPSLAASAHNVMAYGYAQGSWGMEINEAESARQLEMYLSMHDGPNAYDSYAELSHGQGNDSTAFEYQLKAIDRGGVLYQASAVRYRRFSQRAAIEEALRAAMTEMASAAASGDTEVNGKHMAASFIMCYSSMSPCQEETVEGYQARTGGLNWQTSGITDVEVSFGPDMLVAMTHGNQTGTYTDSNGQLVEYSTRVSMVWDLSGAAPKLIQANFAPMGGAGIPSAE